MMLSKRWRRILGTLALGVGLMIPAMAAESVIENDAMKVTYDSAAGAFKASAKSDNVTFVQEGKLQIGGGEGRVVDANDPKWGPGKSIEIAEGDGGAVTLTLFGDLPFVVIKSKLTDTTDSATKVDKVEPVVLKLDLGKPAEALAARGTQGLSKVALAQVQDNGNIADGDRGKNPGSFTYLSIADPETRKGVVVGWLTNDRGSGLVFSDVKDGAAVLTPRVEYGGLPLGPRESLDLESLVVGYFDDARVGLEQYADALVKQYDIKLPPMPTVYCTWYHANASNAEDIAKNADFAKEHLQPFGLNVFQIDDHWQAGFKGTRTLRGDGPARNFSKVRTAETDAEEAVATNTMEQDPESNNRRYPYPNGMKPTADDLKAKGFIPGIWILPFSGTAQHDPYWADKQDLFVKLEGKPMTVRWGGTCLDLTNPKTHEYVAETINRIIDEWGYRYLKLDGLWTGTGTQIKYTQTGWKGDDDFGKPEFHDENKTPIEAYRSGMKTVREAAGPETFILGCNLAQNMRTLGASIGLFDAMRVGPDNGRTMDRLRRGPESGSNLYFLHHRVWYNDPDPLYVTGENARQRDRRMPLSRAQLICAWVTLTGEMHSSSEAYYELGEERVDLLKRTMPSHDLMPRPVDYFDEGIPKAWLLTGEVGGARRDVVGLFHWGQNNEANEYAETFERIGMEPGKKYVGFEYWTKKFVGPFEGKLTAELTSGTSQVISLRPVADAPALLGTSRHIAQGIVDVTAEKWDAGSKTLRGAGKAVAGDPYELRIAAMKGDGGAWKATKAEVSAEDQAAGVKVTLLPQENWGVRALVESPASREVKWNVAFE